MSVLRTIVAAFAYFSTLPVGAASAGPAPDARTLAALPLVGAVLGALAGVAGYAVSLVAPAPLAAAVAFAGGLVLTGALHFDGFLDVCDAAGAPVSLARRMEILKDPRHGTFAVAGAVALAAVWLAALETLPAGRYPAFLAFAAALARAATVPNALAFPYAPGGAAPPALGTKPPLWAVFGALAVLLGVSFAFSPWAWAIVAGVYGLARLGAGTLAARFGGGLVGDAYGFLIAVLEPLGLAALGALTLRS